MPVGNACAILHANNERTTGTFACYQRDDLSLSFLSRAVYLSSSATADEMSCEYIAPIVTAFVGTLPIARFFYCTLWWFGGVVVWTSYLR